MISFRQLQKSASKAANKFSSDKIMDALHAEAMRDYVGEHVFGVKKRSTFASVASATGFIVLGAAIGGALVIFASKPRTFGRSEGKNEPLRNKGSRERLEREVDKDTKEEATATPARRGDTNITRMSNNVEPSASKIS